MKDASQLTIDFGDWERPGRPATPATADTRSAAMRAKIREEQAAQAAREPVVYISFGSGSSGNSCYIGSLSEGGVIVDAGVNSDTICETLRANGIPMESVRGVCLTHDHSDHVRYVYKLLRANRHMRLYCTNRVLNAILRRHNLSKRLKDYHVPIFKEIPFKVAGYEITAFEVPHDANDNAGFCLRRGPHTFVVATDLGEVSERARVYMEQADFLMIEANYDRQMLLGGRYPEYLKARIQTDHGHLDNAQTAALLDALTRREGSRLRCVFLCHLSQDNNTPETAMRTVCAPLLARGVKLGGYDETPADRAADLRIMPLPRFAPTGRLHLR